jgi:type IV pilus assembly protein PilE
MSTTQDKPQDQRPAGADERATGTDVAPIDDPIIGTKHAAAMQPGASRRLARGFTLIELMLVVSVAGVLSGVAYPSFMGQLQKVRRSDALVSMLQLQAAQERWRSNHVGYGALADIGVAATSAAGHYTLQMVSQSESGYEVLASAQGAQVHDGACRKLRLRVDGGNLIQTSGTDDATNNSPAANRQCWSL